MNYLISKLVFISPFNLNLFTGSPLASPGVPKPDLSVSLSLKFANSSKLDLFAKRSSTITNLSKSFVRQKSTYTAPPKAHSFVSTPLQSNFGWILKLFAIIFTYLGGIQTWSYGGSKFFLFICVFFKIIFIGTIIKFIEFLSLFIIIAPWFILPEINEFSVKIFKIFKNLKWNNYISLKKIYFQSVFIFLVGFLGYFMTKLEVVLLVNLLTIIITPLVFWCILHKDEIHIKIKKWKLKLKEKWLEFCIDLMLKWIVLIILRFTLIYICLTLNYFFPDNSLIDFHFLAISVLNTSILKALFSVFILEYLSFDLILWFFGLKLIFSKGLVIPMPNYPFLDINRSLEETNAINDAEEKLKNYLLSKIPYDVQRIKYYETEFRHLLNNPAFFDLKGYALSLDEMLNLSFNRSLNQFFVLANSGSHMHIVKYNDLRFVRPISYPGEVTVFCFYGQTTYSNLRNFLYPKTGEFFFAERIDEPWKIDIYIRLRNMYEPSRNGNEFLYVKVGNRFQPYDSRNPAHGSKYVSLKDNFNRYRKGGFMTDSHPTLSNLSQESYLLSRVKYIEIRDQAQYGVVEEVSAEWPSEEFRSIVKQVIVPEE